MKNSFLFAVMVLYTTTSLGHGINDLKEHGKAFGKGLIVGVLHGATNRGISRALNIKSSGSELQHKIALGFMQSTTVFVAMKADEEVAKKGFCAPQALGHALGQMVAEGVEIDQKTGKPAVQLSVNSAMVFALLDWCADNDFFVSKSNPEKKSWF